MSVNASVPQRAHVGTAVRFTATATNAGSDPVWYRFRTAAHGEPLRVLKDFGPDSSLDWTAIEHEGLYDIEVTARDLATGDVAQSVISYHMQSNVTGRNPIVTPTANPLVYVYSAPSCAAGSTIKVEFQSSGGTTHFTPSKKCDPNHASISFYLAGMTANTAYTAKSIVTNAWGVPIEGPAVSFTTGIAPADVTSEMVLVPAPARTPDGVLLQATLFSHTVATDLNGNVIWYYPGNISFVTRPEQGGYFFGVLEDPAADSSGQIVREFDLAGNTVLETNAARVSEQLTAMGKHAISAFHHEARTLSDGNILVLAGEERVLNGVQGPGPVDVLGDMIIVMDTNLNVVWTWDSFDHLDPARMATLGDTCQAGNCPPTYLAAAPNDWLHGNSVQETPDGNLLYSARSQDWIIKIDYERGQGSGAVLWRLGKDGDFAIDSSDPYPWFSHQHDPQFEPNSSTLTLFDNGNVRNSMNPAATSRGQVLQIDEANRTASVLLNADMGQYSFALGAAQKLPNGDYHFAIGFLPDGTSTDVEVDASGNIVYALHVGAPEYRSFRMRDLYNGPY